MIAVLYPRDDKLAMEIAIKVGLDYDNVYVAPTYRIREKNVLSELEKAEYGIMLIFDPKVGIDEKTNKRFNFLKDRVKKMFVIIPDVLKTNVKANGKIEFVDFRSNDYNDLISKLNALVNRLNSEKAQSENFILLLLVMVFIIALLITVKASK
ncbi:MAG: hypothetical protein ABIL26_06430 [candidate division WOR-3 bacterium]